MLQSPSNEFGRAVASETAELAADNSSIAVPFDEYLHPVLKAFELLTGRRPSPATVARWRTRGLKGVKLRTTLFGGKRMCSVRAAREFLEETTQAADGESQQQPTSRTNRSREAAMRKAETECDRLGA